jgi:quercetin dioxygenase-like cupin family protein
LIVVGADAFTEEMRAGGHPVTAWSNAPGDRYSPHAHAYKKILCCLEGSIVFHTANADITLGPGERMEIEPGVEHSATVGPVGVRCAEAHIVI